MIEVETGTYNFDIYAGTTFTRFIEIYLPKVNQDDPNEVDVPYPLVGCTGKAQLRKYASAAIAYDLDATVIADGLIKLKMSSSNTSLIPCGLLITDTKSAYKWAMELTDTDGEVIRPLEGSVRISAELVK